MREQLEKRLEELRVELGAGQRMLAECEAKRAHLHSTMLRISGAMQVLEELLHQEPTEQRPSVNGASAQRLPAAVAQE
jgi:hypothetical protein